MVHVDISLKALAPPAIDSGVGLKFGPSQQGSSGKRACRNEVWGVRPFCDRKMERHRACRGYKAPHPVGLIFVVAQALLHRTQLSLHIDLLAVR